jgi:hypothetical protein
MNLDLDLCEWSNQIGFKLDRKQAKLLVVSNKEFVENLLKYQLQKNVNLPETSPSFEKVKLESFSVDLENDKFTFLKELYDLMVEIECNEEEIKDYWILRRIDDFKENIPNFSSKELVLNYISKREIESYVYQLKLNSAGVNTTVKWKSLQKVEEFIKEKHCKIVNDKIQLILYDKLIANNLKIKSKQSELIENLLNLQDLQFKLLDLIQEKKDLKFKKPVNLITKSLLEKIKYQLEIIKIPKSHFTPKYDSRSFIKLLNLVDDQLQKEAKDYSKLNSKIEIANSLANKINQLKLYQSKFFEKEDLMCDLFNELDSRMQSC